MKQPSLRAQALIVAGVVAALPVAARAQGLLGDINGTPTGGVTWASNVWQEYSYTFSAAQTTSYLTFTFRNDPGATALDDISLVPVGGGGNLIQNGGMESGALVHGVLQPDDWTLIGQAGVVSAGSLELGLSPGAPATGSHGGAGVWIDGATRADDGIAQAVTTVVGATYTLTFWLGTASRPNGTSVDTGIYVGALPGGFTITSAPPVIASNIDTGQAVYLASNFGSTVNPVFQGGTLVMNAAAATYAEAFTLDNSGTNKIDQDGHVSVFSGVFANAVAGVPGGITIANSGTGGSVTFAAANTYTGATTIGAGATLALAGTGSIAASSGVADGGTFDISATSAGATVASLSGTGAVALGARTLTISRASGVFAGAIGGTGGLAIGGGTEILSAVNGFTGATTIVAGATLALSGAGSVAASSGVAVGGAFDISATAAGASVASLSGAGSVALGGQTLTLSRASGVFTGAIGGAGGLAVAAGRETLAGTNAYTGATSIAAGATLALAGSGSVAASSGVLASGTLDISGTSAGASIASLSGAGSVALGGQTLTLTRASGTFAGSIGGSGALAITAGAQTLSGINGYAGGTFVSGATLAIGTDAALGTGGLSLANATLLAPAGLASARAVSLTGGNVIDTGGNPLVLSGSIGGAGGVAFAGGGTVTLSAANSYAGGTSVAAGGAVQIVADAALGTGALTLGDATTGGTLRALGSFSSARPILVGAGGGTIDANGNALTLTGPVTALGALAAIGGGGLAQFGGATTVGSLTVSGGASANSGTLSAANGVTVSGDGSLANSGTLSATAGTTVAPGGVLANDGILGGGPLTVEGLLRGTGVIAAPTTVSGTLTPGNSPGTLTFTAPVTLTSTATTEIDIDGPGTGTGAGNYSRIVVTGTGNGLAAAGGLVPLLRGITGDASNSFVPPMGAQFAIVSAEGGVSGGFASLTQPAGLAAGTRFDTLYAPTGVTLVVTPAAFAALPVAGLAETANEAAVGRVLDSVRPAAGPPMSASAAALFGPLYAQPATAIAPALDQLAPVIYGDATMTARDTWYEIAASVDDQLAARRDGGTGTPPAPSGAIFWSNAIGQTRTVASNAAPGFDASAVGAVVGIDEQIAPRVLAGIALAGASADVSSNGSTDDSAIFQAASYAGWHYGRLFVTGQAAYLHADRQTRRAIGFAGLSATAGGALDGGGGRVQAGVRLSAGAWHVEPSLTLSALTLGAGAATENGAGALDERIGAQRVASAQSDLAVRISRDVAITPTRALRLSATLGWQHEFRDVAVKTSASFPALGSAAFSAAPAAIGRDAAQMAARFDLPVSGQAGLYATYGALVGDRGTVQNITAGLRVRW